MRRSVHSAWSRNPTRHRLRDSHRQRSDEEADGLLRSLHQDHRDTGTSGVTESHDSRLSAWKRIPRRWGCLVARTRCDSRKRTTGQIGLKQHRNDCGGRHPRQFAARQGPIRHAHPGIRHLHTHPLGSNQMGSTLGCLNGISQAAIMQVADRESGQAAGEMSHTSISLEGIARSNWLGRTPRIAGSRRGFRHSEIPPILELRNFADGA